MKALVDVPNWDPEDKPPSVTPIQDPTRMRRQLTANLHKASTAFQKELSRMQGERDQALRQQAELKEQLKVQEQQLGQQQVKVMLERLDPATTPVVVASSGKGETARPVPEQPMAAELLQKLGEPVPTRPSSPVAGPSGVSLGELHVVVSSDDDEASPAVGEVEAMEVGEESGHFTVEAPDDVPLPSLQGNIIRSFNSKVA